MAKYLKARFESHPVTYQKSGSREKQEYIMKIDKDGRKYLEENGKTDIYRKIQADAESADINNIVARVIRGDTSMLNFNDVYGDFVNTPTNLIEAQNLILRAKAMWASLPNDIKKEYNFDVEKYVSDFGTEHFMNIHGVPTEKQAEAIKEEVKTDA